MTVLLLQVLAVATVAFGVFSLVFPRRAARAMELELTGSSAFGEIRGVYGGLDIGIGLGLLWVARVGSADGTLVLLVAFAALVAGRAISAVLDGPGRSTLVGLALEAATLVLLGLHWRDLGGF